MRTTPPLAVGLALLALTACGESTPERTTAAAAERDAGSDAGFERGDVTVVGDDASSDQATAEPEEPSPIELAPFERFGSSEAIDEWLAGLDAARMRRGRAARGVAFGEASGLLNLQERGVDEGSIVHRAGDLLIVLRHGRLHTVRIGGDALSAVDSIDVPDRRSASPWDWYDEMLVASGTVAVLGYSYGRGTEVRLFDLASDGSLSRGPSYVLRSRDYWSVRNHAARRIGDEMILYLPIPFARSRPQPGEGAFVLPTLRPDGGDPVPLMEAGDVLRPVQHLGYPMIHTIVRCRLTERPLRCRARGIVAPQARTFYVSPTAVYVWAGEPRWFRRGHEDAREAVVYRWPHDGSEPGAQRVSGMPVDQMSFSERDQSLFVAVRAGGSGDGMWSPEVTEGDLAMAQLPLAALRGGIGEAPDHSYTPLARPGRYALQNRFVGDVYLYGNGSGWLGPRREATGFVRAHRLGTRGSTRIELGHGVDRVEALGEHALIVGSGGGELHFTTLALDGEPRIHARFAQPSAAQGETRTHAFYFRDDGDGRGVVGLPVRGGRRGAWRQLFSASSGVLYLDARGGRLQPLGALAAGASRSGRCRYSCIDWYGNSRPLFVDDRVLALLGDEIVEGTITGGAIAERRRVSLAASAR